MAYQKSLFDKKIGRGISDFLFRGQANSNWSLKTTLERYIGKEEYNLLEYYRTIRKIKSQIETLTKRHWDIPSYEQYNKWLNKDDCILLDTPGYDFMIYLRHHGFPSPLLNWTRSPYIAAYFAFQGAEEKDEHASIYVLLEDVGKGKSYCWSDQNFLNILSLGPYIRSHSRHFIHWMK